MQVSTVTADAAVLAAQTARQAMKDVQPNIARAKRIRVILMGMGVAILCLMCAVAYVASEVTNIYHPRALAASEFKAELAQFHLWLEEIIAGDHYVKPEDVWLRVERAEGYGNALLKGTNSGSQRVVALTDREQRMQMKNAMLGVAELHRYAGVRLSRKASLGTPEDQYFDAVFKRVNRSVLKVQRLIQADVAEAIVMYRWIAFGMGGVVLALLGVGFWALRRNEMSIIRFIHNIRQVESELLEANDYLRLYKNAFNNSGEAIIISDRKRQVVYVNPAYTRLTGYTLDDVQSFKAGQIMSHSISDETRDKIYAELTARGFWRGELQNRTRDGRDFPQWVSVSEVYDEEGRLTHYTANLTDITERKAAEERIHTLAHYDTLTGLFNRYSLEERLELSLLLARRNSEQLAVMFIDMDRFKTINDTLGHHVGDLLLVEVGQRLRQCVRESDLVARLGGDEFVVVLQKVHESAQVAGVTSKIARALNMVYAIDGRELYSSPSVGVSMYPQDGETVEALLMAADSAMYHAKDAGRNTVRFFSPEMTEEANRRMAIERDLPAALDNGEFSLVYQPQVHAKDSRIRGFEALIRWQHPEKGLISPMQFIPVAEQTGFIEQIGEWVLTEACRQLAAWKSEGIANIRMSVNLSAQQLRSEKLVDAVRSVMAKYDLTGADLELEVTETTAMQDAEQAAKRLAALKDIGVGLAIDDFGTGYSSLSYLKRFPIGVLKLDREFVKDIQNDENDAAISSATLALAERLGLEVVAEGVETEEQRNFLGERNCNFLQGYLFGKPMSADHWNTYLHQEREEGWLCACNDA